MRAGCGLSNYLRMRSFHRLQQSLKVSLNFYSIHFFCTHSAVHNYPKNTHSCYKKILSKSYSAELYKAIRMPESTVEGAVENMSINEGKKSTPKQKKKDKGGGGDAGSGPALKELSPWPSYIQERLTLWDKLKAEYDAEVAAKTPENIQVTLPDGKILEAQSWKTTPYQLAQGISQGLADSCIVAKVKFLGEVAQWDDAEQKLSAALDAFGAEWSLNPEDVAFYGPKIDIQIFDALRRPHQCATIQLDFQLPQRFNLAFITGEGDEKKRPVIIHRAILGSVERLIAILTESCGGRWPLWLSPRQVLVASVGANFDQYADQVRRTLFEAGFEADADLDTGNTLNKKIRNAQVAQYNFILVVGAQERDNHTVNVRTRDNKVLGEFKVDEVVTRLRKLKDNRVLNSEEEF